MRRGRWDLSALTRLTELADYIVPLALRTAGELKLPDHLSDGSRSIDELATLTGTHPGALRRLLRCLAARGVFAEVEPGRFALTPMGELLTGDHRLSLRDAFPLIGADLAAWACVDRALKAGQPAFSMVHGRGYWDYMADDPEASGRVDRSVESSNRLIVRMFDRLYDWSGISTLVDVGGGNGSFLAGLMAHHPALRGIVFDRAHVIGDAERVMRAAGVSARCALVTGSFFGPIPRGGDAYLLKTILHDWSDDRAGAILRAIRAAMPPRARLLVIEAVLEPGNDYDIGKLLDLNSFVLTGGVDRSVEQFERLLLDSGFRLDRVLRTTNALTLLRPFPMHLNVMTQCSPSPQFEGLWRHPEDGTAAGYRSFEYWIAIGRKLEAACIDALFFADVHGLYDVYRNSWEGCVRHAVQAPSIDPMPIVAGVAAATRRLGVAVTYSTSYHPPYECARVFSSLDHVTNGRIGWNIVTSYLRSAGQNGLGDHLPHDDRYDRADEFVLVCRALWERSWDDGSVLRDAAEDMFADPDRVHEIRHEGRWFKVRGPHQCEPSPQRTPVLYQAGASRRGTAFAARHAEVVFVTLPDAATGATHVRELREQAERAGRNPDRIKTLQAAFVLTAPTREAVRARVDQFAAFTSPEGEITKMSGWMGFDFAAYAETTPIGEIPNEASRSIRDFLQRFNPDQTWTVGDVRSIALFSRRPHRRTGWLIGTPEQIADQMEEFSARSGVDGFNLIPCPPSSGIDDVCTLIVPELQRRGLFRREDGPDGETLRERYFGAGRTQYA